MDISTYLISSLWDSKMLVLLLFISLVLYGVWIYLTKFLYWEFKKIPHVKPWPIVGNMGKTFLNIRSFAETTRNIYQQFPDSRYCGLHQYSQPALMIRDPELIKDVCIKHFDAFHDHPQATSEGGDTFFNRNLIFLQGKEWHDTRALISPIFSTNKLKAMFSTMTESTQNFINHFTNKDSPEKMVINAKDIFQRYSNDVSASVTLGVACDSFKDRTNEIFMLGKRTSKVTFFSIFKFFGLSVSPTLMKVFYPLFTFFDTNDSKFITNLVKDNMKFRREKQVSRLDMLEILMQVQKDNLSPIENEALKSNVMKRVQLTDEEIASQIALVYIGVFDSGTNLLCTLAYELAFNPEVQEKLRDEIDATLNSCDHITYEILNQMKYMNMVVSETIRLWPSSTFTDRVTTQPYTIEAKHKGERRFEVDLGTYLWIPIYAIHRDPRYFPNPLKFDPERFNEVNKEKIKQYTYLPFGLGPRMCIASRFVVLLGKVMIFHLLSKFRLVPVAETAIPYDLACTVITLISKSGPILGLEPR